MELRHWAKLGLFVIFFLTLFMLQIRPQDQGVILAVASLLVAGILGFSVVLDLRSMDGGRLPRGRSHFWGLFQMGVAALLFSLSIAFFAGWFT